MRGGRKSGVIMRLIGADALTRLLEHKKRSLTDIGGNEYALKAFAYCIKRVHEAPTVEAEPVVHCKDCVYWGNVSATGETEKVRACEIFFRLTHECWFCSNGAKMDGKVKFSEERKDMKAYAVRTDYSEGSGIVFAENHNQARRLAQFTDACEDAPYIDIRAKRMPKLDGMENCEPKDNPWLNEDVRLILVKEYGWGCIEPNVYEDCDECCAKQYCRWCED